MAWRRATLSRARLLVILGGASRGRTPIEVAEAAIAGGARLFQLRLKAVARTDTVAVARRLMSLCEKAGALLIVNDDAEAAVLSDADGVHVGQGDLPAGEARGVVSSERLLGLSIHTSAEALSSMSSGADYAGIGPIFASPTKPGLMPRGIDALRETLPLLGSLPGFAIGGIDERSAAQVIRTGVHGLAVASAICTAADVAAAARDLIRIIEAAADSSAVAP